jgi:hypothetical protein
MRPNSWAAIATAGRVSSCHSGLGRSHGFARLCLQFSGLVIGKSLEHTVVSEGVCNKIARGLAADEVPHCPAVASRIQIAKRDADPVPCVRRDR